MFAIVLALATAGVMGIFFQSTRWIGILCIAALTFLFPGPVLVTLLIGLALFIFIRFF